MNDVVIHRYYKSLTAIEFGQKSDTPQNFLIFIGGLGDGFLTVPYVPDLAQGIEGKFGRNWTVVQALISSSYQGYGTGSLKRDVRELSQLVKYLRTKRGTKDSKVVLMGHSTGCQDTIEYLSKLSNEEGFDSIFELNGGILQAPVSDSEAVLDNDKIAGYLELAKTLIDEGKPDELLPLEVLNTFFGAPFSAYRFYSLASKRGDDDYFSSYLTDEDHLKSFGRIKSPILVLYSGKDQFVPASVDKAALLQTWKACTKAEIWSPHSGIVKGANHNIGRGSDQGAVTEAVSKVVAFLGNI
ncbi:hypothetical protein PUMCH_000066 [Australozyma saopauloensis]|uniref:Uncharacterized protein n=1 Tax=Australozyma saopauloensis TaxID=291208 RepID=A0AAX4H2S5_9ASCO|nr:hypothetical protein PUMCH_000066 [[Candida] saopauloensis]